jgi:hypothetical protein
MFRLVLANFVPPEHRVVLIENKGLCRITARAGGLFVCNLHINIVFVVQIATVGDARQNCVQTLMSSRTLKAKTDSDHFWFLAQVLQSRC